MSQLFYTPFNVNNVRFKGCKGISSNEKKPRFPNVPLEIKKKWMHIDAVETDKLAWMKDLPKPPEPGTKVTSKLICV